MKVVQVKTVEGKIRYYLEGDDGQPVEAVLKFLRFKDNVGYARNTLRRYTYHLKLYFTYLNMEKIDYTKVTIDDLAMFVGWLQNPWKGKGVLLFPGTQSRKPQTVNKIVDTVVSFYDYLLRHEEYEGRMPEMLVKFIRNPSRNYKGFLYGIAKGKGIRSHELKLKESQKLLRTITKENVGELLKACTNGRDYFLLYLLFETGLRIGEALSLWVEDFDPSDQIIEIKDRGELENQAEIKTISSPRSINTTPKLMDAFMEYICLFHTEDIITNHVFIKLHGENSGKAMDYSDVDNLFRILRERTGINVTPHMFRHTSLSLLHRAGWEPELLRIRAGHKNIYTTINTYVHPSDEEVAAAFNEVSQIYSETSLPREADE